MTKYKDLDMTKVKECCKKQAYKRNGKIAFNCDKCPLRRTDLKTGTTLFCWFRLKDIYEGFTNDYKELQKEPLSHEDEWIKYLLETEE